MKKLQTLAFALILTLNLAASSAVLAQTPPPATTPAPTPTESVTSTPIVSAVETGLTDGWKGKKVAGVMASGYFEINSDFESLYFSFPANSFNTAGFGFGGYFEMGFSEKFSGQVDLGFSRLIYSSLQRNIINESFFTVDVTAHYHFLNNAKFDTYGILGAGAIVSSGAVAPVLDLGVGNYFKLTEQFSIKAELLFKSAIILNRAEARVGVAYHF